MTYKKHVQDKYCDIIYNILFTELHNQSKDILSNKYGMVKNEVNHMAGDVFTDNIRKPL